jgi:hypothetical protein
MTIGQRVEGTVKIVQGFTNDLNATAFSAVTNQCLWMGGSVTFTLVAAILLLRGDGAGKELAYALLAAWGVKSGITAASGHGKRLTDKGYIEAKLRGEAHARASGTHAALSEEDVK